MPPVMRKVVTVGLLSALLASVVVASAAAVVKKPKPWQWTPTKVALKLINVKPINGGEIGSDILSVRCVPQGRGVAGRYSRFICTGKYGGSVGRFGMTLAVRIRPIGTGKLCVVAVTVPNPPRRVLCLVPLRQAAGTTPQARVRLPEPRRKSLTPHPSPALRPRGCPRR